MIAENSNDREYYTWLIDDGQPIINSLPNCTRRTVSYSPIVHGYHRLMNHHCLQTICPCYLSYIQYDSLSFLQSILNNY